MPKNAKDKPVFRKQITLKQVYPDDLKSYFVDHMLVQHQPDRFVLSFFEVWIPPIMGSEEQQEEHLDKLESVDAKCVARLVVTPEKMRDILRALSDNMDKYEKLVERLARESKEGG